MFVGIGVDGYLYFTVEGAECPSDVTEDQIRDMKNLYNIIQIRAKQEGYTDTVPICWGPQWKQVSMIEPGFPFVSAIPSGKQIYKTADIPSCQIRRTRLHLGNNSPQTPILKTIHAKY